MNHDCSCHTKLPAVPALTPINATFLAELFKLSAQRLAAVSQTARAAARAPVGPLGLSPQTQAYMHVTPEGEILAATSFAEGETGDIVLRGLIAGIPFELHLRVALEGSQIAVTLHLTKPFEVGPYTWRFDLGGALDAEGRIVRGHADPGGGPAADGTQLVVCPEVWRDDHLADAAGLCLPSLAGGPAAYVACVTSKLGSSDAAAIALCIAKNCR